MKILILIVVAAALAACSKPTAEHQAQPPENGAQYKKDKGIALTDAMKKAIALKVAEVEEAKVAPSFTVALHVMGDGGGIQQVSFSPTANAAAGWLTAEQAAIVKPGMDVELVADTPGAPRERGVVSARGQSGLSDARRFRGQRGKRLAASDWRARACDVPRRRPAMRSRPSRAQRCSRQPKGTSSTR